MRWADWIVELFLPSPRRPLVGRAQLAVSSLEERVVAHAGHDHLAEIATTAVAEKPADKPPPLPFPQIGNRVWKDTNANGFQDTGEPGLANVRLDLYRQGTKVGTTVTDARGNYAFNYYSVHNGTETKADDGVQHFTAYEIRIEAAQKALVGMKPTKPMQGADAVGVLRDSDIVAGATAALIQFATLDDDTYPQYDAGFVPQGTVFGGSDDTPGGTPPVNPVPDNPPATGLTGRVFVDLLADRQLNGQDYGLAGVTITAAGKTGTFTAVTDAAGRYRFESLPAGEYIVTQGKQPAGYKSTTPNLAVASVTGPGATTVHFGERAIVDLQVKRSVTKKTIGVGGTVTFTYTIKNLGAKDATSVLFKTPVPKGYTFLSADVGTGKYATETSQTTFSRLAAGEEVIVKVRMRATREGTVRFKAVASSFDGEQVTTNNIARTRVTVVA